MRSGDYFLMMREIVYFCLIKSSLTNGKTGKYGNKERIARTVFLNRQEGMGAIIPGKKWPWRGAFSAYLWKQGGSAWAEM